MAGINAVLFYQCLLRRVGKCLPYRSPLLHRPAPPRCLSPLDYLPYPASEHCGETVALAPRQVIAVGGGEGHRREVRIRHAALPRHAAHVGVEVGTALALEGEHGRRGRDAHQHHVAAPFQPAHQRAEHLLLPPAVGITGRHLLVGLHARPHPLPPLRLAARLIVHLGAAVGIDERVGGQRREPEPAELPREVLPVGPATHGPQPQFVGHTVQAAQRPRVDGEDEEGAAAVGGGELAHDGARIHVVVGRGVEVKGEVVEGRFVEAAELAPDDGGVDGLGGARCADDKRELPRRRHARIDVADTPRRHQDEQHPEDHRQRQRRKDCMHHKPSHLHHSLKLEIDKRGRFAAEGEYHEGYHYICRPARPPRHHAEQPRHTAVGQRLVLGRHQQRSGHDGHKRVGSGRRHQRSPAEREHPADVAEGRADVGGAEEDEAHHDAHERQHPHHSDGPLPPLYPPERGEEQRIVEAPGHERPVGPVPEAREGEHDEGVACLVRPPAAEGDVEVVAEPVHERDMPAAPEVADAAGEEGRLEILRELDAQQFGAADGYVGVSGEVAVDLHGKGHRPEGEHRAALPLIVGEDGRDALGDIVRDDHLLQQTDENAPQALDGLRVAECARRAEDGDHAAGALDRPGHQLREEGDEHGVAHKIARGPHASAVDVDHIREALECVETDAGRQYQAERYHVTVHPERPQGLRHRAREEVEVFEHDKHTEAHHHRRAAHRPPYRRPPARADDSRRAKGHGRHAQDEQQQFRVPPAVEDIARHEQQPVLRPCAAPHQPVEPEDHRQEHEVCERCEQHFRLIAFVPRRAPPAPYLV